LKKHLPRDNLAVSLARLIILQCAFAQGKQGKIENFLCRSARLAASVSVYLWIRAGAEAFLFGWFLPCQSSVKEKNT
ncbi:hypothetical protein QVO32_16600, partial [Bacteroides gallinaceum]|uniref:hypothetical protein n=1 Tax=Bacteroides gallinaceum TaxID=1462571 RepID=UPI0025AB5096